MPAEFEKYEPRYTAMQCPECGYTGSVVSQEDRQGDVHYTCQECNWTGIGIHTLKKESSNEPE